MNGSFRFARFHDQFLLTNDAGRFAFLPPEDFFRFVHHQLPHDSETWQRLQENFFCYDTDREVYLRSVMAAVRENHAHLFSPTSLFILAVTNRCNNACVYCQANGGAKCADLDIPTARKIIDRIAASPAKHLTIEFQGGEPLMNFPILQEVVRYSREKLNGKDVSFALVSNLSLVTEEVADWIAENNISVSTSLDGPKFLHDLQRPRKDRDSSYEAMLRGLARLRVRNRSVGAIQTTTRVALPYAREIVETYASLGFQSVFLRPLTCLGAAKRRWNEIGYTPEEFLAFYREGLQAVFELNQQGTFFLENHTAIFASKLFCNGGQNYMELRSPCGAALGQLAFTASGNVYTCDEGRMMAEMGDDAFKLGNVFENGYDEWLNSNICKAVCSASLLETLPGCCDCVYQPYCGVCPVVHYAQTGLLHCNPLHSERCKIYHGMLDTLFELFYRKDDEKIAFLKQWIS